MFFLRHFFKDNLILILSLLLLGLLFILWGRIIISEMQLNIQTTNLTTTQKRVDAISYYGWEADPGGETTRKATIPNPLDAVYVEYNRLQTPCGFDLRLHQGKTVDVYTYPVLNFPYPIEAPVYVNILVDKGTLIGGDLMTRALDGFMLPLDKKFLP